MRYGTKHQDWTSYLTAEELDQFRLAEDRHRWHKEQARPWEELMVRLETVAKGRRTEARKASGFVRKPPQPKPAISPLTESDVLLALQMLERGHGINGAAVATNRKPRGLARALVARGFDPKDGKASAAKLCAAIEAVRSGGDLHKVARSKGIDAPLLAVAVTASKEHDKRLIYAPPAYESAG